MKEFRHCDAHVGHGQREGVQAARRRVLFWRRVQMHAHVLERGAPSGGQYAGESVAEVCEGVCRDAAERCELREARVRLLDEPFEEREDGRRLGSHAVWRR